MHGAADIRVIKAKTNIHACHDRFLSVAIDNQKPHGNAFGNLIVKLGGHTTPSLRRAAIHPTNFHERPFHSACLSGERGSGVDLRGERQSLAQFVRRDAYIGREEHLLHFRWPVHHQFAIT